MVALEIEFEKALYLSDEGYKTDDEYDLPWPLNKSSLIHAVPSVATAYFNTTDYQKPMILTPPSIPRQTPVESPLHWVVCI